MIPFRLPVLALLSLCVVTAPRGAAQSPSQPSTVPVAASSPMAVRIGGFTFTPGGFLDLTTVYRSSDVGSGIGTNFAAIPYSDTVAGRVSEFRESAQNSRLSLRADGDPDGAHATVYVEADFLGNAPPNIAVTSNSATLRMRAYFADLRHGRWEWLAGQDWSLLTPNRSGLSPYPADIFYSQNPDANFQAGMIWARQPQFRITYHANRGVTAALSLEQPEQYIGGSGGAFLVTLPGGATGAYAGQVDNGSSNFASPGFTPDVIAKVAWDGGKTGHALHAEIAGLESEFRVFTPATNLTTRSAAGGVSLNLNTEVATGLHLIANSFLGDGGGRYFLGMAPDFVVRQSGAVSPLRASGGVLGFEDQITPHFLFYGYFGGLAVGRDFDLTAAAGGGPVPVGYGFTGASNASNRSITETTLGLKHTFWQSPLYGTLLFNTEAAYVSRNPFGVTTGTPANAHLGMGYLDLRYVLP